jgi:hypothetical protein
LPALAGIAPVALRHCALQRPLDVRGGAQAKQIRQSLPLGTRHHRFVAPFGITAQQVRPTLAPERRQQRPQPGAGVLGIVLIAGMHLNPQHQAQIRHHVGVIAMRRPPRFVRIVADHRALLMAVERLDRGIDIKNPRLVEQRPHAIIQMPLQPLHAGGLVDLCQRPPQRIFTDHFAHAEQRRIDRIAAQRRDVRLAPVPGQHR